MIILMPFNCRFLSLETLFMKRLIFVFAFVFGFANIFAQSDSASSRSAFYPAVGDYGVMGNISGLLSTVQTSNRTDLLNQTAVTVRYVKSENLTFRLGVAPKVMRYNVLATDSVGKDLVQFDSTARRSQISFRPGVEYHLKGTKRLDPYAAADLEFGIVGGLKIGSTTSTRDTTGTALLTRTITEDGGYTLGAKMSFGMNYYISPKIFVGAEYGFGFYNITTGGDRQEVAQYVPVSGTQQTTRILSSNRVTQSNFFVDPMIQLTFGYFFGI